MCYVLMDAAIYDRRTLTWNDDFIPILGSKPLTSTVTTQSDTPVVLNYVIFLGTTSLETLGYLKIW